MDAASPKEGIPGLPIFDDLPPVHEGGTLEQIVAQRTQEIEHRQRIAASLGDILKVLNSSRSLQEVLEYICKVASQLLGSSACVLHHIEGERAFVAIQASYGLPEELRDIPGFVMNSSPRADSRIMNRQAIWTSDFQSLPQPSQEEMDRIDEDVRLWREVTGRLYRAWLAVPLVIRDEVYGSLAFYYPQVHEFKDEEIDLAQTFANQAALAIENASLRLQAEENAAAAERSRLARDLHDAVTQTLFAASLIAEVLPRLWDRDQEQGKKRLEELRQLTRGALAEMRTLLLELRPKALMEANLGELFRHLVDAFTGQARIPAHLYIQGEPAGLPPEVKVALYRITQEALNNIAKHARASQVEIRLSLLGDGVELTIRDDGRGFDLGSSPSDHLGLSIMQERAASIAAAIQIDSAPGKGTRITTQWRFTNSDPNPGSANE